MLTYKAQNSHLKTKIPDLFLSGKIFKNFNKLILRLTQVEVLKKVARLEGFEPPTYRFVAGPSIQLR